MSAIPSILFAQSGTALIRCTSWLDMVWWALLLAWAIVLVAWVCELVAYIKCYRENEKAQRECHDCIREYHEHLRMTLQSKARSLGNLGDPNLEDMPGEAVGMSGSRGGLDEGKNLAGAARMVKQPSFLLKLITRCRRFFGCHKPESMRSNDRGQR